MRLRQSIYRINGRLRRNSLHNLRATSLADV
jgi:hypothetical protein